MKITKLGHACVLVETPDRIGLFDPGVWADTNLLSKVENVDRIIYTHAHNDHFDVDILRQLLAKSPHANVITNNEVARKIQDSGLSITIREESGCTRKFPSPHAEMPVPNRKAPMQNGYHFKEMVTHPGDNHDFSETKKVLLMPFVAPWGKMTDAVNKVLELKPEYVLPIHDWFYNDESRQWLYAFLKPSLEEKGIKLLSSESGITHEI